jgi:hypothetical protein
MTQSCAKTDEDKDKGRQVGVGRVSCGRIPQEPGFCGNQGAWMAGVGSGTGRDGDAGVTAGL